MTSLAIFPQTIKDALRKVLYDKNIGSIESNKGNYQLLIPMKVNSLDKLKQTVIKRYQGKNIILADIADVKIKKETSPFIFHDDAKRSFIFLASIKPSANINKVSEEIIKTLNSDVKIIDPKAKITTIIDPAKFIKESIVSMWWAILASIISASFVVLLFLKTIASTFIIFLAIPLSLAGGVLLMTTLGIQINLLSLSAMALAVGMVVDGAIVIIDNMNRHLASRSKTSQEKTLLKLQSKK